MQKRTKRTFNFNPFLLTISLFLALKFCEDKIFPEQEGDESVLGGSYAIPADRDGQSRPNSNRNSDPVDGSMSDEERLDKINEILREMGHKPVGNSEGSASGSRVNPQNNEEENADSHKPTRSRPQAEGIPDRRITRKLDALGYVINEPNTQRDRYCLGPEGCPVQNPAGEESIILEYDGGEVLDEAYYSE
jgi:hypothetical protein